MKQSPGHVRTAVACLLGLVVLNAVMLASLLAGVEPHPPPVLGPLGGAGPFIGANLALSVVAALYCLWQSRVGYVAGVIVVVLNVVTFGPHKYFSETASFSVSCRDGRNGSLSRFVCGLHYRFSNKELVAVSNVVWRA